MVDIDNYHYLKQLPKGWQLKKFDDLILEKRNGIYKKKEFHGRGTKIINMGELFGYDFISNQEMKRIELNEKERDKYLVRDGDLLFARRSLVLEGSGKCSLIVNPKEETTFESSMILTRINQKEVNSKFLYYLFASPLGRALMASIASQTAVSGITGSNLVELIIPVPPLPTQRKIAGILSAYDDLIENNARRIEILEEMARMLYREWFVKFRFPVGDGEDGGNGGGDRPSSNHPVELVESELGLIPKGWEVKTLKDVCTKINYGFTAKAQDTQNSESDPKFLRITDIVPSVIDWERVPYCEIEERKIDQYLLSEGDIVIARTGATVGYAKRLHKRHEKTIFASYLVRLRVDESIVKNEYIGLIVESDEYKQFIKANMTGSAQPQANAQIMTSLPILIPPQELQEKFKKIVTDILDQKELLQIKNINLRKTRDLLLPRLISGEIDVEELDINLGAMND
ncbi:restriction endonuclease subunit S [Picosynechococcus sp. NKBG15041c]|uniref:restriction endonuclease subunit S n=1 Tax=Picosynechococcus sp. NKBG15041c TaxID=1407650 RepID=UPI0004092712|nr:restriction endonuclease subunit S [Picosynechococcus sp. NKBG15041c]